MDAKLQELTDKIYNEGVEKGKKEASALIDKAKKEATEVTVEAEKNAEVIITAAKKEAEDLMKNTKAELQLFANQSVNALKTEIANLICGTVVTESIKAATTDKDFMRKVIADFTTEWAKRGEVEINAKQAKDLEEYFAANIKTLLDKGVKINEVKGQKSDFEILPAAGGYKVTFGEDEFISYFKGFLRPKLVELLFNK